MNRPRWFPDLRSDTEDVDAHAILACQGNWWLWGGSVCKKPQQCVAEMACYFVAQAAKHTSVLGAIHWSLEFDAERNFWQSGFDPEPRSLSLFDAA